MDLLDYLPRVVFENLSDFEISYLRCVFERYKGYPLLQQLWQLMDEQWLAYGCNALHMDERISAFYRHPVWILNGLFIEHDPQSFALRKAFSDWVLTRAPTRVADFGGGFGGLARLIGAALPHASVEVVEPHPLSAAVALAASTPNVRYVPCLSGEYDLLIATDVFEHVPDPIAMAASSSSHLRIGGHYLIANCFSPVIACHLPQHFHLSISWEQVMQEMGLHPQEKVQYGRAFERAGSLDENAARRVEAMAKWVYTLVQHLPKGRSRIGRALIGLMSKMQVF